MRRARLLALLIPLAANLVGPASAAATGHLVRITSTLEPSRLTIAPGDTVTWRNDDGDRHRMRSQSGPREFDSGNLEPGETFRVTFTVVGTYAYVDEREDDLQGYWGTIVVAERSTSDPSDGAAGGGGGDGAGGGSDGGGGSTAPTTASIGMADRTFRPGGVTIPVGGTVTWRNDDDREHTATSTGDAFDSGVLAPGATYRKSFPSAGTFPFLCLIHPEMTGTVTVTGGTGADDAGATPRPAATPRPTSTPRPSTPTGEAPDPGPASVAIVDLDFEPGEVEVAAGSTITWTNGGGAPHTATATDGAFDSGTLDSGDAFTATFATPGRFEYACAIHPSMTGVVVVRAASGAGQSAAPTTGTSPAPTSPSDAPPSVAPSVPGAEATAPPEHADASVDDRRDAAGSEPFGAGIVSTLLALGLIGGALMVGTGLLLGMVRRGEMAEHAG